MANNMIDLKGRTAVVTGGAQGFGKAITERFVRSGARVAIWDRDTGLSEKTAKALGGDVHVLACSRMRVGTQAVPMALNRSRSSRTLGVAKRSHAHRDEHRAHAKLQRRAEGRRHAALGDGQDGSECQQGHSMAQAP